MSTLLQSYTKTLFKGFWLAACFGFQGNGDTDKTNDVSRHQQQRQTLCASVGGITQWQLGEIITVRERGEKKGENPRIGGGEGV